MNIIRTFWKAYCARIKQNCTSEFVAHTSLEYWQNKLFANAIIYLIPLSLIALIPGLYMAYIAGLMPMIAADLFTVFVVLSVAFVPGFSIRLRKLLFLGVMYMMSMVLLIYLGGFGPGLLYLLSITVIAILILGKTYGYITVVFHLLVCSGISLMLYFNVHALDITSQYPLNSWIAVSSNLIFLSAVAAYLIPIIFDGLQSAILRENNLRTELEYEEVQLKSAVLKLNEKNEDLEQFSYIISHDLKEPLRMIKNFMQLLDRKYASQLDDKANTYIHFAVDGAERMSKSIDDLLKYSRVGRLYTDFKKVDANKVMKEVISDINPDKDGAKTNAIIKYNSLPTVDAVPVTFKMLMQNLVSNAIKYQPEGQQAIVEITHEDKDDYWEFTVSDNGIGISEEYFDEIFQVFRRLHTREKYQGNGMGLAISKKIIEHHGGKIWVTSDNEKGSSFHFTLKKMNNSRNN